MPIDPNIILRGQVPQFDSPLDVATKALSMRQLARQGQVQEQQLAEQKALKDALTKNVVTGPDGKSSINRQAALSDLYKVNPAKAMETERSFAQMDQEDKVRQLETLTKQTDLAKQLAWSIHDPASYEAARQTGIKMGLPNAENLPAQYPGEGFVKRMQMNTLSASERLAQMNKDREFDIREKEFVHKSLDRKEARADRQFQHELKRDEKEQALMTPFGLANTVDDAKQLKAAYEAKKSFDGKLQALVDLRKKYGTEYYNREAVERGKQLSKDLLLTYKDMAKLGVLSQSDEAILNAIIPEDPLAQDWVPGQDPIMHRLVQFKADSDRDFKTRVDTRTRTGMDGLAARSKGDQGTKRQTVGQGAQPQTVVQGGHTYTLNPATGKYE